MESDDPSKDALRRRLALEARESALGFREQAGSQRERTVGMREESVHHREEAIRLREELVRAREELERANAERKAALAQIRAVNEQLVVATLRAHEASEESRAAQARAEEVAAALAVSESALRTEAEYRERLIGIVGHDLRNPVTAIAMAADLLARDEQLPSRDRSRVESIRASTRRVKRIIDELLDFTLAHLGGGLRLNLKDANLRDISRRVVQELELGHEREVRIECRFSGDLWGQWDADRLEQVISNLAGNALQHGAPGKPIHLTVTGGTEEVVAEIVNEGPAIPPALLPRLFVAFSRGNPGERTRSGSLGLGLYIAHEIVRRHGGTLSAGSGEGLTTFTVRLPRQPPSEDAAPPPAPQAKSEDSVPLQ